MSPDEGLGMATYPPRVTIVENDAESVAVTNSGVGYTTVPPITFTTIEPEAEVPDEPC